VSQSRSEFRAFGRPDNRRTRADRRDPRDRVVRGVVGGSISVGSARGALIPSWTQAGQATCDRYQVNYTTPQAATRRPACISIRTNPNKSATPNCRTARGESIARPAKGTRHSSVTSSAALGVEAADGAVSQDRVTRVSRFRRDCRPELGLCDILCECPRGTHLRGS
jgi:hypothetical protein